MHSIATAFGIMLLLLVAYDVYATILHARARGGPISETLNRVVWHSARWVAFSLPRQRRHKFLNTVGPLLLPALIVVFILLLVTGFALIYLRHMPADFIIDERTMSSPWFESLYFSGVTLTTVGYGDITPRTFEMRLLALVEGASGFTLISLAVTYLISVYRALENKRVVALTFYHQADEGADVAGFISHHFVAGRFYSLDEALRTATRDIQELLESHIEHPIIHYFHPVETHKSMPRMLFLELETCAVIHACLDEDEYPETCRHPQVRALEASARHVLGELVMSLDLERRSRPRRETPLEESQRWEQRFKQTVRQLKHAGIKTRPDLSAGWELYRARREEWAARLQRFALHLGYEWDEITGDRNLRYAADEQMEQPEENGKQ